MGNDTHQGQSSSGRAVRSVALSLLVLVFLPLVLPSYLNTGRHALAVPGLCAMLPFTHLLCHGMQCGVLDALILTGLWSCWLLALSWPLALLFGRYTVMVIYVPLLVIFLKKPYQPPSSFFLRLQTLVWDWPLILWARILAIIGRRGLAPFYSEIDDFVSLGSMPIGLADAEYLQQAGVGAVVNLCREYRGPEEEYLSVGLLQHWAPTADICEPEFTTLLTAVRFIATYRAAFGPPVPSRASKTTNTDQHQPQPANPLTKTSTAKEGVRVFIHCKAGRARSAAVAYCYLLSTGSYSPDGAFAALKGARPIIEASVRGMRVVRKFQERLAAAGGDLDLVTAEG